VPEDFMSRFLGLTCTSIAAVALLGGGTAFAQGYGGPGGSNYLWGPTTYDFVDISTIGTTINNIFEDQEHNVPMPFSFPFYGNSYDTVRVGGTGGVMFILSGDLYNGNDDLPDEGYGSHDIAAFWDSLDSDFGEIRHHHDAANNRFIISWDGIYTNTFSSDRDLTFQMHLYSSGAIAFHYQDATTNNSASLGARATVGIQDRVGGTAVSGGNFLEYSFNSASLADGMAIAFVSTPLTNDLDGDGIFAAFDCDDTDAGVGAGTVDADGDLFWACTDCDDTDPAVSPGAIEVCLDGVDNNCNGFDQPSDLDQDGAVGPLCGGDDCDDNDATLSPLLDADGDGVSTCDLDCDDADPLAFPGAPELCDGLDQNCDGDTDDENDNDGDGYAACTPASGQNLGGDCDDTNPAASPILTEICGNGFDDDCDGTAENADLDGDGFIDDACGGTDCDDADAAVNVDAVETCDGNDVDENCNGLADAFDLQIGATSTPVAGGGTGPLPTSSISTFTLDVPVGTLASPTIDDIDVTVSLTHTWVGDLIISITSPAGTTVEMSSFNGGSGDNYVDTTFDDESITPINAASAPFTGSFAPENLLSALDGEVGEGLWTLTVQDVYCCNPPGATLDAWSLTFNDLDDADGDGSVDSCGDCDAADATIFPGAEETCGDGIIQDCDLAADPVADADADGEDSDVCGGLDCDDTDPLVTSTTDADLDTILACDGDCDDADPLVFPGADETACDTIDSDCDGFDGGALDEADVDGDGETICDGDCDDGRFDINTSATELCNGLDNDCDGTVGIDADLDGFSSCDDDCDDGDAAINPDAAETCDGNDVDEDCDGLPDDQDTEIGGGVAQATITVTEAPAGGVAIPDCCGNPLLQTIEVTDVGTLDDLNVTVNLNHTWDGDLDISIISPAGTEVFLATNLGSSGDDYIDTVFDDEAAASITTGSPPFTGSFQPEELLSDLDGESILGTWTLRILDEAGADTGTLNSVILTIESLSVGDVDADGYTDSCGDCDSTDATINPGALEICGDGIDQDCSGADDALDADGDLEDAIICGGTDCDDTDPSVNAAAVEVCNDGVDNDCNVLTVDLLDADGDGDTCDTDCDDADPLAFNGFFEICDDGIDNDCDATTLDLGDNDGDGENCDTDCDDTNPNIFTGAAEAFCDTLDNDCDPTTGDIGDGDGDTYDCDADCDDANAAVNPAAAEVPCDGIDNDCNPATVSDVDADGDGAGCDTDCDDTDPLVAPGLDEICDDGIDNDCDALTADIHDADLDGDLCDTDCNDDDPLTFTGAPEYCFDTIDQDCDGVVDEAVDDSYTLGNDGSVRIGLCSGLLFPFCGTEWDTMFVQANGRVTFGSSDTDHTESVDDLTSGPASVNALWTDLDPSGNQTGSITITEDDANGVVDVIFDQLPESGAPASSNSVTMTLWDDGQIGLVYGTNTAQDGLVGWACGDGATTDVVNTDLSDYEFLPNELVIGSGTEDAVFELFTDATNSNDLSDEAVDFCGTAGNDADGDGWTDLCGDCDDEDITSFPGAEELCDTIDNDCDGTADNPDADDDTYIDIDCGGDDCDDADDTTYPGAPEQCDGLDNDCDGAPEEGSEDEDGDGVAICAGDCDDGDDTIWADTEAEEAAEELCDLKDNDCDGIVDNDFTTDRDGDGYHTVDCGGDDCNDDEDTAHPDGVEVCDQLDNDCNDIVDDVDADGDGEFSAACGGLDCDDDNAEVNTGAEEVPYDGIDNDCSDGDLLDVDGDGYQGTTVPGGTDCDDNDATVNTGALENGDTEGTCSDGKDNNCDGAIDIEDELCSACENCNASYTGEGPMGTAQLAFALLMVLGVGVRRRRA